MSTMIETPKISEILWEEFMEPMNISAYKLANDIHVPVSRIQDILHSGGIKVTDKERTIADCLKDMDKIAGPEEVRANISSMSYIDEQKLLEYLSLYDNQFLYQKAGFLLWDCRETLGLTDGFFDICREHIGKSKRYLTKDNCQVKYIDEWRLMVPVNILNIKNGEVETDAAV